MNKVITENDYISDLESEKIDDMIINSISIICKIYLANGSIEDISTEELEASYVFCNTKITELTDIRTNLNLKNKFSDFENIGHNLDLITAKSNNYFTIQIIFENIQAQISSTIERLELLLEIILKMKKELE